MKIRSVKVQSISTRKTTMGRWIIVLPMAQDWAWSGARWVNHHDGVSLEAPVCNFETESEAVAYAMQHVVEKTNGIGNDGEHNR